VDDVVNALMAARTMGSGELVNIGSNTELSVTDLHGRLSKLTDASFDPIYAAARPGELQRIYVDNSKASEVLDWKPTVGLDEGLKQTVAWFRSNPK
jgi:UDP-glucose 4-epimerase